MARGQQVLDETVKKLIKLGSPDAFAISVSLGTLFFLLIGVATCMRIMIAFSGSFSFQLQPFLAAMLGGFVGLYLALGARNPSPAITFCWAGIWAICWWSRPTCFIW